MKKIITLLCLCCVLIPSAFASSITIFAASSLTDSLNTIINRYNQSHHEHVIVSYASSSTLAKQIEQGAPAAIFISADQNWMDYLASKQLIASHYRKTLLSNQLVVIAAKDKNITLDITKLAQWLAILGNQRIAVGNPMHVPAGIYAKQALTSLGLYDTLQPKFTNASNVRDALMFVERSETPLGIVYKTDALISHNVHVIATFPSDAHSPIEYPIAITKGYDTPDVIQLYRYLQQPEAKAIFAQYGFKVPQ